MARLIVLDASVAIAVADAISADSVWTLDHRWTGVDARLTVRAKS